MNLGVFNKVNLKVSDEAKGMYSEWTSLAPSIQNGSREGGSVLSKLNAGIGKEVALQVVRQLASNLGIAQSGEPSPLTTDREVRWCMEVICYGLTLTLSDHDTIRDCVNVYCEWLSALDSTPKSGVPKPVRDDPNPYARKMIADFRNLFIPRKDEGVDATNKQAVLCHRVLRTLQNLARTSQRLTRDTWESLLLFLLTVNDVLLAPPNEDDDVGDQLCERVLGVLFEVWLLACARCFPSPPLWKTMRESCMTWRHHVALVEQWNRINFALTVRLLSFLYGPSFPEPKISEEDLQLVPVEMSDDCVAQSWFRFLHCIGNPVNLCRPAVVSQTDKFLQFAIGHDEAVDPSQHPCLNDLPQIFLKAVKGFSALVDGFLGIESMYTWEDISTSSTNVWEKGREHRTSINEVNTATPPTQRRLAKSFSVASSTSSKGLPKTSLGSFTGSRSGGVQTTSTVNSGPPSTSSLTSTTSQHQDRRSSPAPNRPKCNSVLHLFGEWLFEAAFVGTEIENRTNDVSNDGDRRSSSLIEDTVVDGTEGPVPLTSDGGYEAGRAEAIGALCRVFCAKKTGEEILPVYLARFYAALKYGLSTAAIGECGETTVAILSNSSDLLRLDLDGVQVLVPSILSALETVLPEKETETKSTEVSKTELRRASIHLLLSMLALPLHYENLPIRELSGGTTGRLDADRRLMTFVQLKPRLVNLLINALQVETDAYNAHMLLGGLLLNVQDSAMSETTESHSRTSQDSSEPTSNLLSSASDSAGVSPSSTFGNPAHSSTFDYHSLPDDTVSHDLHVSESTHPIDSAHALFVRATYLVCHRLISSWKTDLNVSLAALELLMGLARIHVRESDALECKRAVKWLCDYIIYQCWRPPQAHSKDLHSTIVAAFHCCSVWLIAHPYLLRDKDCLYTALEVAELGISGTKSIGKPGEPICMKADKRPKPASMRVRESAEHLLSVILEHVGYFPSECGPESPSSLLDEASLSKYRDSRFEDGDSAVGQFRYFVSDDSIVLALLEEPLGNDQDPQPTVTVVVRGPFGRYAWTMQQRHLPRYRSGSKYHAPTLSRPVPMHDPPVGPYVRQSYFPDTVDRTPEFKVDTCLRPLDPPPGPKSEERDSFDHLLERQYSLETAFLKDDHVDAERSRTAECLPPRVCHDFQTARLFLSHFGFVSYDGMTEETSVPALTALDSSKRGFRAELETLDRMSTRTCDTAHIFYVAAGQRTAEEIVSNVTHESNVSTTFLQFLSSLGWPVDVSHHPGWTGNVATSWRFDPGELTHRPSDTTEHGGSLYNGEKRVLYWADASSEIAFVVPTRCRVSDNLSDDPSSFEASQYKNWYESGSTDESFNKPRSSSEFERQPSTGQGESGRRRNVMRSQSGVHVDLKIVVAWLESFEDHLSFPIDDLLDGTKTGAENNLTTKSRDVFVIFLHELKSGLLRVRLKGPTGRMNLATPLVDGMVLSNKVSGPLVRQTALNMARRRRLDCDMYQPPHVRRRLKIQDITNCYKLEMTRPELLTSLFSNR